MLIQLFIDTLASDLYCETRSVGLSKALVIAVLSDALTTSVAPRSCTPGYRDGMILL